ncbi:MAG: 4Fe-4S dicluster domain-containing protein [Bacteroidetes bacterium]|nr:4Fe-4S dicluster domain-containing protein [Bacteroidota bacterium]
MSYIENILSTSVSLLKGMKMTGYYFSHPKEIYTRQYPENRKTLKLPERFRAELTMPHDEFNRHRCSGCTACEIACPNGTIKVLTYMETTPDNKKKKRLDTFIYRLSMCTFCNLCVDSCPSDAIKFNQHFEHSVTERKQLTKVLNRQGSTVTDELK